jgi:hypothetical protein
MARYALVQQDGTVWSVTDWNPGTAPDWRPPAGMVAIGCPPEVGPGWVFAPATGYAPPPPPPVVVPDLIPMFRGRIVLRNAGLLDYVRQAALAAGPDSDLNIMLEYSNYWARTDQGVLDMQAALGLTDAQLDAMFVEAGPPAERA